MQIDKHFNYQQEIKSPGLVVMWGDSCSKGREFESQHHILDGHFSHLFVVRIITFVCKDENKRKRDRKKEKAKYQGQSAITRNEFN